MHSMKNFNALSEQEILALAISLEEEDERVYADFAEGLRHDFPGSATVFDGMRVEESGHRRRLIELYRQKFGEHIPLIRRQDVKGFVQRRPVWLVKPLGLDAVRKQASAMEVETRRFYERASARSQDVGVRRLLDDLAQQERSHARPRLRRGVCDAADWDRVRRRIGGGPRGWYQHGVRGSVVRRRHTNGSRTSVGARVDHRTHDRAGRPRAYA